MASREYIDTMLKIQVNGRGIGRSVEYAQDLAIKLGYALGIAEGHLQAITPKDLVNHPEILDDLIEKSGILADELETISSVVAAQIGTIKKLITIARTLAESKEAENE